MNTRVDKLPSVLDFAFTRAVRRRRSPARPAPTSWPSCSAPMPLYEGGAAGALQLPTFLGNHDAGRFAMLVRALRAERRATTNC